jgi:hypothetical protein
MRRARLAEVTVAQLANAAARRLAHSTALRLAASFHVVDRRRRDYASRLVWAKIAATLEQSASLSARGSRRGCQTGEKSAEMIEKLGAYTLTVA